MLDFKIKRLDKDIANKIAAGEVVESKLIQLFHIT